MHLSLSMPLRFPVRVRILDGVPRILAGGVPVTPVNLVLLQRQHEMGSTPASLNTYMRAAHCYIEFCAHRNRSLLHVSNEEFIWFKHALLGDPFPDAHGQMIRLAGSRGRRTSDLMLTLLYSLAADIEERYDVSFDWLRYKGAHHHIEGVHGTGRSVHLPSAGLRRTHRIRWAPRKVVGLPDEQFTSLLQAAWDRWGNQITDGDLAFSEHPESQRGALFYRNLAILMVLRYAGSRRSEVVHIRLDDIDRAESVLYLVTKGHRGARERRLPVLLFPWVCEVIWIYLTRFRPPVSAPENQHILFLSHSVQNYGQPLTDQSVRALINALRSSLPSPWNTSLTPHMLRHSFGYDLQKQSGPAAVVTNMRHASSRSGEPYAAGPEVFAEELLARNNPLIERLLTQAGLLEKVRQ
jgi:integrase